MKNFYVIMLFIGIQLSCNAQFLHLNVGQESKDPVTVVFENGNSSQGFVKNNPSTNIFLRALSALSNSNSFSNPELQIDFILFKSKLDEEYTQLPIETISKVIFHADEDYIYDRTLTFDVNSKTLEIDRNHPRHIFFQANDLIGIPRYRIFVKTSHNASGQSGIYHSFYYIKHLHKNESYYISPWSLLYHSRKINYFRIIGINCPEFISYLDKLDNKKSSEYKAFDSADKQYKKDLKAYLKKATDKKNENRMTEDEAKQLLSSRYYEFLFEYMNEKYKTFGCVETLD